jgi:RHS repeat-associated protein
MPEASEESFARLRSVAMRNVSSGTIYYYAEDMLGSSRTIVQAGQTTPCYDADFYPFGGERIVTNSCTQTQNYKFEGKERDAETGNDDFGARYYNSRIGRWLSADWSSVPVPVPYANLTNPQTLNLFAMVSDNPETFADLNDHCPNSADSCNIPAQPNPVSSNKNVCNVESGKCDHANTNVNGNDQDKAQNKDQTKDQNKDQNKDQPTQGAIPGKLPPANNPPANAAKQKTYPTTKETEPELRVVNRPPPKLGPVEVEWENLTTWQRIVFVTTKIAEAVSDLVGHPPVAPMMVRPNCNMSGQVGCGSPEG